MHIKICSHAEFYRYAFQKHKIVNLKGQAQQIHCQKNANLLSFANRLDKIFSHVEFTELNEKQPYSDWHSLKHKDITRSL